jgi:hypothetical protein
VSHTLIAVDAATIASLCTAAGTLILAVATFAATRSANRSARVAESALRAGLRPVLVNARSDDPAQKVRFVDNHWIKLAGGRGAVEAGQGAVYLSMPLRNVGTGIGVLHAWHVDPERDLMDRPGEWPHADPAVYRRLTRDLLVAAGDVGFWQGAVRDVDDPHFDWLQKLAREGGGLTIDLLYGDQEGGQRTITRFFIERPPEAPENEWFVTTARHWNLDRPDPR